MLQVEHRRKTRIPVAAWDRPSDPGRSAPLAEALADFLITRRWYRDKTRAIRSLTIEDMLPIPGTDASLLRAAVTYAEGDPQTYLFGVAAARGADVLGIESGHLDEIIARLEDETGTQGILYDAFANPKFTRALLSAIGDQASFEGQAGKLEATQTQAFNRILSRAATDLEPKVSKAEQSNTSIIFGQSFILKVFRKLEAGINPDIEIGLFLTEKSFTYSPAIAGVLKYSKEGDSPLQLAILQEFIPNQGDAWKYTMTSLAIYFEKALRTPLRNPPRLASYHPLTLLRSGLPDEASSVVGPYLESARILGDRTARMHAALTDMQADADFLPEPLTEEARRELYESLLAQAKAGLNLLRQMRSSLGQQESNDADKVLAIEDRILAHLQPLLDTPLHAMRTRYHGDFHLGQVLYTGEDFKIIDYEGEPARTLDERRRKGIPMRDVAGMVRSFQYAPYAALFGQVAGLSPTAVTLPVLESYADFWTACVGAAYLEGYFSAAAALPSVPSNSEEQKLLLDVFLLQKALYEVGYELNNRPAWVSIPLRGILNLLAAHPTQASPAIA
jgi:maltose alpha-D-glucosyltransferase/alpha-amylase